MKEAATDKLFHS